MGPVPQRVKEKDIEIAQAAHGFRRYLTEVGEIRGRSEAETVDLSIAVNDFHRFERRAEQFQDAVDPLHLHASDAAVLVVGLKNIAEHVFDGLGCWIEGIERDFAFVAKTEWTHIIQAQDVVGVGVRVNDGVDVGDVFADGLFTEVGCSVNENAPAIVLDHDRRAGAAVPGIGGVADCARTTDGGHAHGRSAAQYGKGCFHFLLGAGPALDFARALVISTQAMRSSNSTCCKTFCSRSVRLPLVFSCRIVSASMVWRAPTMSTAGGSFSWRMAPNWISAVM